MRYDERHIDPFFVSLLVLRLCNGAFIIVPSLLLDLLQNQLKRLWKVLSTNGNEVYIDCVIKGIVFRFGDEKLSPDSLPIQESTDATLMHV